MDSLTPSEPSRPAAAGAGRVASADLLIVGAGPAGAALALFLARDRPDLARRTLVVDKSRHPRHKVCAGGLIPHVLDCLRELDVPLDVPNAVVHRATVDVPHRRVAYDGRDLCRVVRRSEFDARLVAAVRERGVVVEDDRKVLAVARDRDGFRVLTDAGEISARAIVGADGSGSAVRRALFRRNEAAIGRAVMCDLPRAAIEREPLAPEAYRFDFRAVPRGLRGYLWEFPCWIGGEPHVNLGVYALDRGGSGVSLPRLTLERAAELGVGRPRLEAFPIRWYDPGDPIAGDGALLVGDAAGCDPLMGEGISYAFEYARLAADHLAAAFDRGDFALDGYSRAVRRSWFGRKLARLGLAARFFYGSASGPCFALAARSRRLQEIGIRWYNGVDGWDREAGLRLAARLVRGAA